MVKTYEKGKPCGSKCFLHVSHPCEDCGRWQGHEWEEILEVSKLRERNAELELKTAMFMGVGNGHGRLFVHGDYESIKACQLKIINAERARQLLRKIADLGLLADHKDLCIEYACLLGDE